MSQKSRSGFTDQEKKEYWKKRAITKLGQINRTLETDLDDCLKMLSHVNYEMTGPAKAVVKVREGVHQLLDEIIKCQVLKEG